MALALFSSFVSSITNAVNALRSVRLSSASQEAVCDAGDGGDLEGFADGVFSGAQECSLSWFITPITMVYR